MSEEEEGRQGGIWMYEKAMVRRNHKVLLYNCDKKISWNLSVIHYILSMSLKKNDFPRFFYAPQLLFDSYVVSSENSFTSLCFSFYAYFILKCWSFRLRLIILKKNKIDLK